MKPQAMRLVGRRFGARFTRRQPFDLRAGRPLRAIGAVALGALALGAFAVGAVAIGRLAIGRVRIRRMEIDELTVRKLRITESLQNPPDGGSGVR
jgi:hypothetical protein